MIAGKLAHLAGETHAAIGQQDFGFADPAGIDNHLPRRRIARMILIGQAEIEITQRDPDAFAAPAYMNDLVFIWQQLAENCDGFGRACALELRIENVRFRL